MTTNKNYLLALLTVIMMFNYIDRVALGLLLQDVKSDLSLSDTQLGLLTGIAFALFYASMGIPIARWADRGNRVTIISLAAALWSAAVALCGVAANFTQMLLLRVGVAVGEAGCHPPALSLIADYFTRELRPRAISRYMLGWPLALILGNVVAGWINELYGWRATFLVVGLPGAAFAALAAFTLREPRQNKMASVPHRLHVKAETPTQTSLREISSTLWSNVTFRHLLFCFSVSYFFGNGIMQWQPAFFIRSHGLNTGELGTWFAIVNGVGTLLGTYLGGELAFRYAAGNERLQLRAMAGMYVVLAVLSACVYLAPNYRSALVAIALSSVGSSMIIGPAFAATQTLVPAHMRAMSIAVVMFFANLIGMGLGPLAVGAISDTLRPALGEESLRYALLAFCPGYFWCTWHLWRGSQTVAGDVAMSQARDDSRARAPIGAPVSE